MIGKIGATLGKAALGTAGGPFGFIAVAWEKKGLILGLAGWILLAPAWLHGCSTGVQQEKDRQAAAQLKLERDAAAAREKQAEQALEDELAIAADLSEAENAIEQAKDRGLTDAALRANCDRLRRRGWTDVPQCVGLESGAEGATNAGSSGDDE